MRLTDADIAQMWKARAEAAEARIARVAAQLEAGPPSAFSGVKVQGYNWCSDAVRAALAEPVGPQPSACATCGGTGWMPNPLPPMTTATDGNPLLPCPSCTPQRSACATCEGRGWILDWEQDHTVPCPSCTPPDPERYRSAVFTRHEGGNCVHGPYHPADLECSP